jgi:hypothetical protein
MHAEDVVVSGENEILTPGFVDNLGERSSILPDDLVRYTVITRGCFGSSSIRQS